MADNDPREAAETLEQPTLEGRPSEGGKDLAALEALSISPAERYELVGILGEGGMGEVRLCTDRRIGRQVAMKVVRKDGPLRSPEMRARFLNEARVQGQTEHPSIVPVYDVGTDAAGSVYFTMRRIEGKTLEEIIEGLRNKVESFEREYSRHKLLTAFGSACLAVHFAHTRGVFHCDLKPANLMLGAFGEVYVLDWGLAATARDRTSGRSLAGATGDADEAEVATREKGAVAGTPGYMAPEQLRGEAADARSDVYALGALLYELLTLTPMHSGKDANERCAETIDGTIEPPSARAPERDIPPELEAVCMQATTFSRRRRYPTARDLYDDLERYLEGDRDLSRRRTMSHDHATRAAWLAGHARTGGPDSSLARSEALRTVGRALALDPDNPDALRTLVGLITEPPAVTPPEVVDDMHAMERSLDHSRARGGLVGLILLSIVFPAVCLMQGIRDLPEFLLVGFVGLAAAALGALRVKRPRSDGFAPAYLPIAVAAVVGVVGSCFHPTVFTPTIAMPFAVGYTLSMGPRHRFVPMIACSVALILPCLLEWLGVLAPSSTMRGELSCLMPRIAVLPPLSGILLVFGDVTLLLATCYYALLFRNVLTETQRRVCVAGWQLRQLLPRDIKPVTATEP
jgi:serine/threonine protein kinase